MRYLIIPILLLTATVACTRKDDVISVPTKYCTQAPTGRIITYQQSHCQAIPTVDASGNSTITPCAYLTYTDEQRAEIKYTCEWVE
jgi:hypothetical protein